MSDYTQVEARLVQDGKTSFGEKLKATREAMGLSVQEAATRLNLSPRFIQLFENEDLLHTSLPPIYLRGHLRSYARTLNIPEKEIELILDTLNPTPATPITEPEVVPADSLSPSFPLENNSYFPRLGTFFITVGLLSSVAAWWYLHSSSPAPMTTTVATSQVTTPNPSSLDNIPGVFDNKNSPLNTNSIIVTANNDEVEHPEITPAAIHLPSKPSLALTSTKTAQDEADDAVDEPE